ncbi:arylsulfatase [Niabella beijingensis]|uniref:arylsulfatase n=1 Tax=Niabella beijingensis TaxID=2872700 RepID=UPI001CC174EF|nr:arylsulfatase [Niabella beijingensis]MBZ4191950.1 arylsulfatase [Niabella beijingensis]
MNKYFLLFFLTAAQSAFAGPGPQPKKDKRPNIILILADDLGYSDLGCFGGEIHTPNLDGLAKNGLQFTQFYNISRCCPTRASLLTGLYNHDAGIGAMTAHKDDQAYKGHLGKNTVTIAEVLKQAGYRTAMSGKWHVSNTVSQSTEAAQLKWLSHQEQHPLFSPIDQYPTSRGFEKFYGTIWGVVDYFDPFSLVEGTKPVTNIPKGYYHTDAINEKASGYIREFSRGDQPFFLYVAQNAPHWPLQALPEDIEKYKDRYTKGWEAIREQRYKRMVELGLIDPNVTKLSPRHPAETSWEANPNKEWDARAMAVHAAMVDRMDQGIGRIIATLKETGTLDNTIIVFLSDNGASAELCERYGPGFDRPGATRNGQKVAYNTDKSVLPGPQTTFFSIGPDWANVANTPYRLWKSQSTEGGIRTPTIVYWPKGIKNKGGKVDMVGHVMDFMATFIELAGASYPETYNGNQVLPLAGVSFAAALKGGKNRGHDLLFNEHEGSRYVRQNEWKLVMPKGTRKWSLYNMISDAAEINDLAAQYPDKVKDLSGMWDEWAAQHHVLPKR